MITDNCKQSEDSGGGSTMVGKDDGTRAEKVPQSEGASEMIDKSNINHTQNDLTKTSGLIHTMARRASFSEAKAGDGQCRKRSNEPIKRKSHEKQHRKSTGDEIIEQRLAALAKENNALKSQLEEQIRLNSVIVANPSLASLGNTNLPRIVFANGNGEQSQSSSSFGNIMPNFAPFSNSNDKPPPFCALQKSERSAFSVIRPGANVPTQQLPAGSCQQNEQNDVQVQAAFNAANAFVHSQQNNSSEFARLAAQLAPFSLFPSHPFGTLFPPPPPPSLCSPPATVFRAPATVTAAAAAEHGPHTVEEEQSNGNQTDNPTKQQQQQQQNDQKKQFTQMHSNRSSFPNLSMFSNLSDHLLESKAIASSVTDVHSTGEECPLDFSKRGQQKQQHLSLSSSSFSSSLAAGMRPKSVIISTSQQNDTVAAASWATHLNLAPPAESIGQMLSKGEGQMKQQQQTVMANNNNNKSRKVPKRRSPSSDALTRCSAAPADAAGDNGGAGHWTPVIQQYKHGPSQQQQQMGTASSSSSVGIGINNNAKQLKNVHKNVMELAADVTCSSSSSSHFPLLPPPPPPFLPHFSSSSVPPLPSLPNFTAPPLLQLLMLRGRIGGAIDEHGILGPPLDLQIDQPTTKFADSTTTTKTTTAHVPPIISQLVGADSSSSSSSNITEQHKLDANGANCPSSSSSSSMLGTLLALPPNDCRTSPTVPASRTEFCSGLALSNGNKKCAENEPQQQMGQNLEQTPKLLHFSSTLTTMNNDKTFSNLNSDSEQSSSSSGGQNSPNSAHTSHSHTSDSPPSTLPGAGSTVTTVCGSDRTRRGSSSPTSGCSGDDSSSLLACDKTRGGGGSRIGDEAAANRRPTHSQSSPPAATASATTTPTRAKLRNSEELERFVFRNELLQYMDRRRRNNEAAKRCRANRRAVFEYRSRKAQLLEAENGELRQEMVKLNAELEQLKALIAAKAAARFSMST